MKHTSEKLKQWGISFKYSIEQKPQIFLVVEPLFVKPAVFAVQP